MRTVDLAGFNAAIDKFAQKDMPEYIVEATRMAALYTWNLLQDPRREPGPSTFGSPVLSGRYRASIRIGINQIDYSVAPASKTPNVESIPAPTVDQARALLANLKAGRQGLPVGSGALRAPDRSRLVEEDAGGRLPGDRGGGARRPRKRRRRQDAARL